ncbi:unnamed protein product [Nippostrongylus brasiliensis]|uniref:MurNAc-LAA domain-containing protein n=1 Tax=Nippostrongylus brasiliensis TaxID=27835 RepID=A0A0N4YAM8_NIPBR|nr:unnamed protein product [Nippostrongylus brasiliensis]
MKITFIVGLLIAIDRVKTEPTLAPARGSLYAVDISVEANADAMRCLKTAGYSIVFVRGYDPSGDGQFDENSVQTIRLANSANLDTEVYMIPNPRSTKNGTQQFLELHFGLKKSNITLQRIWLQVMNLSNWDSHSGYNTAIVTELMARHGYSSVRGKGESGETPANFKDFVPFFPWWGAAVKQFAYGENVCGLIVNRDLCRDYYWNDRASKPVAEQLGADEVIVGKATGGAHYQKHHF